MFSCSCKLPWTGQECGEKTGKKLHVIMLNRCEIVGDFENRTLKVLPGLPSIY